MSFDALTTETLLGLIKNLLISYIAFLPYESIYKTTIGSN